MEGNVVNNLCSLTATDLNFTSELNRATAYQIKQAIEKMKQNGGKNKGRIKACERELENRRLTKKDKNGKYVSKEHLSILCNTFSSEHRFRAILQKLGELEDAERKGLLLQLPCREVNRMDNKWIPGGDMTQKMLKEEYCKAVDDFAESVKNLIVDLSVIRFKDIDEIAEQLKVGGADGN